MNEDRELDRISQLFESESAALRKRTLVLSAIPVLVGAVVVVTAYYGVKAARAKLAETEELRNALLEEVDELEAKRIHLEQEVEQQKAVASHFERMLPQEEKRTADLIQSGLEAYNKGDWQQAVETLESAVERDPSVAEARYRLGISLWRTGNGDAALEQMKAAFKLDQRYEEKARDNPLLKQLWDYRELVASRRGASDRGEERHIAEGLESSGSGSFDKARESYDKALEADPKNAKVLGLRGFALYKEGDYDQAIASYKRCLEIEPRSAECHYNLGLALWQKQDRKGALAAFRKTFELDPEWQGRALQDPAYRRIQAEVKRRLSKGFGD